MLVMMTFLFITALVVDIAQVEMFLRTVQAAVDSAALAGADQLKIVKTNAAKLPTGETGQEYRTYQSYKEAAYRDSKEVVLASLARSPLKDRYGIDFNPTTLPREGCLAPIGSDSGPVPDGKDWKCREFDFGSMKVLVERGLYIEVGQTVRERAGEPTFISLEPLFDDPNGNESLLNICTQIDRVVDGSSGENLKPEAFFPVRCLPDTTNPQVDVAPCGTLDWRRGNDLQNWRCSPYPITNAIRVKVTLKELPTFFGGITAIGLPKFLNLTSRETVASRGTARNRTFIRRCNEDPDDVECGKNLFDPW
jgi:hypothetical protein